MLRAAQEAVLKLGIGGSFVSEQTLVGGVAREQQRVHMERFTIDGLPMLSASSRRGGLLQLDLVDHAHPRLCTILTQIAAFVGVSGNQCVKSTMPMRSPAKVPR